MKTLQNYGLHHVGFVVKDLDAKAQVSLGKSFVNAIWALMVPIIILGGIYGGVFTPTEASIVASDYAILVSIFVYKELKFRDLPRIFAKTALTSGTVMILVACAAAFGRLLTMEQVPKNIASSILGISDNKIIVLLLINLFLLVVGMLMKTLAAIIILAPFRYLSLHLYAWIPSTLGLRGSSRPSRRLVHFWE